MIEPSLEDMIRSLADKKKVSLSNYIRALIIDDLSINGLLPEEFTMSLFKGVSA